MNYTFEGAFDNNVIIVLISLSTVTLPLNAYVMWLMLTGTRSMKASDIFNLNLAVSEFLFTFNSPSILLAYNGNYLHIYIFTLGFLFTGRPLFQTYICVYYYFGVMHPVYFVIYKDLRYRMASCFVAWLVILASCSYCRLFFLNFPSHFMFFIQNLLFMAIAVFCTLSVLKSLKKPGPGDKVEHKRNKTKQMAFRTLCFILSSMIVNFICYIAPIPLQYVFDNAQYIQVLTICIFLSVSGGVMQPLLYLHRMGKLACFKRLSLC